MKVDYLAWHRHIAAIRPPGCILADDSKKAAVAILKHDKVPSISNIPDDFLWINCKCSHKLSKLLGTYKERNAVNNSVLMCHAGTVCNLTTKLEDMNTQGIVVLEVVIEEELPRRLSAHVSKPQTQEQSLKTGLDTAKIKMERAPLTGVSGNKRPAASQTDDSKAITSIENQGSGMENELAGASADAVPISHSTVKPTIATISSSTAQPNSTSPATIRESLPAFELPSKQIPNQNVNQPFLKYLDHYYETSESLKSLSLPLPVLVDHVWSKWQSLPEKSDEKTFFTKPVLARIHNGEVGKDEEAFTRAMENTKPEIPQDTNNSQSEPTRPLLDFKAEFGEVENTTVQAMEPAKSNFKIQDMMIDASLEELETFVTRGVHWLDAIKAPLQTNKSASKEAVGWLKMCDQIKGYAARTKTVIGVVGNTGAGKSSVINALLDQEQLLPTNTMRACTAVVTEIAYNFEDGRAYRAEIEFIDKQSWQDELGILFSDLINSEGNISREISTADSDAGIAYAKIKAVYPKKTKEDIARSTIPNLIKEVSHILGKTQKVQEDDSLVFYKRLQKYIDSQEKVAANKSALDHKAPREMEFWPLIKVVRIYCRSESLATGATIVDLPGVHDANAARAAVAEGYMKQCSGLWIVAPIIRAVDDKAAKNLLGQTFKRQLKMDGGFNQISFICSKTDDISLTEATASLGLEEINEPLWAKVDRQAAIETDLERKIKEYAANREALGGTLENLDDQIETWQEFEDRFEEGGEPLYAPVTRKRKSRARTSFGRNKRKRLRRKVDDDDIETESELEEPSEDDYEDDDDDAEVSVRKPLTMDEISEQISKFKEQARSARKERASLNHQIKEFKEEIQKSVRAKQEAESAIAEHCIKGRNDYSKEAIRQDFAAGVRELDQEKAQEDDEQNFDPEAEARDYDEVARSLPVFCVSSRGYQQLCGMRQKDAKVHGFTKLEQTEIPALQEHCKNLTISGRTAACRKFLIAVSQLANSLAIWSSSDGTNKHLTPEQRENEERFLAKSLKHLDNALEKLTKTIVRDLTTEIDCNVLDKFDGACHSAETKAIGTADRWGDRPDRDRPTLGGGYVWATYKAVCRRNGAYTNARGPIEFNDQLAEPMMVHILAGWERLFTRKIPAVLSNLGRNLSQLIKTFHSDVAARSQLNGIGTAIIPMLEQQLVNYQQIFENLSRETKSRIDGAQREINREFVPSIMNSMVPGYIRCVQESGPGSFARMKGHMHDHVTQIHGRMFRMSCENVESALKTVLRTVKEDLENASDEIFEAIKRDYRSAFSGIDLQPGQMLPKWQREMRKATASLVERLREYLISEVPPGAPTKVEDDTDYDAISRQLESESNFDEVKIGNMGRSLIADTAVKTEDMEPKINSTTEEIKEEELHKEEDEETDEEQSEESEEDEETDQEESVESVESEEIEEEDEEDSDEMSYTEWKYALRKPFMYESPEDSDDE